LRREKLMGRKKGEKRRAEQTCDWTEAKGTAMGMKGRDSSDFSDN
jgi:hypothetical protein